MSSLEPAIGQTDQMLRYLEESLHRDKELIKLDLIALSSARLGIDLNGTFYDPHDTGNPSHFSTEESLAVLSRALPSMGTPLGEPVTEAFGSFLERNFRRGSKFALKSKIEGLVSVLAFPSESAIPGDLVVEDFIEDSLCYGFVVPYWTAGSTYRFRHGTSVLELYVG